MPTLRLPAVVVVALWALPGIVLRAAPEDPTRLATAIVGAELVYVVAPGDSLTLIGAKLGADPDVIARANGLTPTTRLHPGDHLQVDNRHLVPPADDERIVLNVPQRMLFFHGGRVPFGRPIAAGQPGWRTPVAPFTVERMEVDPTWNVPVSIQAEMRQKGQRVLTHVPPGPSNPLGTRYIGLSLTNIGIHGTNAPASVYRHGTHGCIRMQRADIEELYEQVHVGMTGRVIYEPVLVGRLGGRVFVEVHRDVYRRSPDAHATARRIIEANTLAGDVDWALVEAAVRERAGIARDVTATRLGGASTP